MTALVTTITIMASQLLLEEKDLFELSARFSEL